MAHEETKDFNAMLHKDNGMPRIQRITDAASIQKYGGDKMYLAPPLAYDHLMKTIPRGQVITLGEIRAYLAGNLCRCSGYEGQLRGIRAYLDYKKQG